MLANIRKKHLLLKNCTTISNFSTSVVNTQKLENGERVNINNDQDDDDDRNAMRRRLAQLAEEAMPFKDDPKAGPQVSFESSNNHSSPSSLQNHTTDQPSLADHQQQTINKLHATLSESAHKTAQQAFLYENQRELAISTKIPSYVNKRSLDIAIAAPWSGSESSVDLANRMLQDAYKPLKNVKNGRVGGGRMGGASTGVQMPKMGGKLGTSATRGDISSRLIRARENSLDYEIHHKRSSPSKASPSFDREEGSDSGPSFRELYQDRFLGPSTFAANLSAINSLASQRIEDAMKRGEFDGIKRGVNAATSMDMEKSSDTDPTTKDHNFTSPYIDTTEYFLNKIIKQQGAAPIWIDKQGSLKSKIENFRKELATSFAIHRVHEINKELNGRNNQVKIKVAEKEAKRIEKSITTTTTTSFKDTNFESTQSTQLQTSIDSLNSSIRSYNLQAPSVSRWTYLSLETELQQAYEAGCLLIVEKMYQYLGEKSQQEIENEMKRENKMSSSLDNFNLPPPSQQSFFGDGRSGNAFVNREESITSDIKSLFKWKLFN